MTTLVVNGKTCRVDIKGHETLLEVLRLKLNLTGTKNSCDEAQCGSCTVLVDGQAYLACITLASEVEGRNILTIEGLSDGENLHPLQEAFLEKGAVQCGFCIPGMIMASKALLNKNPDPSNEQIKKALDGNLCRCAGYSKIIEAVSYAKELSNNSSNEE